MNLPPLYDQRAEILSTLKSSTTTRAVEFADWAEQTWQAQAARAAAGRNNARKRSERIRKGIRQAAGALPLNLPNWPNLVADRIARNPAKYGLASCPCDDVIRDEWAVMKIEATTY
jgi:hypothetical protein